MCVIANEAIGDLSTHFVSWVDATACAIFMCTPRRKGQTISRAMLVGILMSSKFRFDRAPPTKVRALSMAMAYNSPATIGLLNELRFNLLSYAEPKQRVACDYLY
eukprot:SAG31_NODE_1682_length_7537_cov_4.810164_8_plen_105_part_00